MNMHILFLCIYLCINLFMNRENSSNKEKKCIRKNKKNSITVGVFENGLCKNKIKSFFVGGLYVFFLSCSPFSFIPIF